MKLAFIVTVVVLSVFIPVTPIVAVALWFGWSAMEQEERHEQVMRRLRK